MTPAGLSAIRSLSGYNCRGPSRVQPAQATQVRPQGQHMTHGNPAAVAAASFLLLTA